MLCRMAVCSFFYALEIKEDDMGGWLDYKKVNKITCFLEGDSVKGVLILDAQKHGQDLVKAKINLLLKKLYA